MMEKVQSSLSQSGEGKQAIRYNSGKPRFSLIDLNALVDCARVLEFGAVKYERDNWKLGMSQNKILDSLLRHIADLQAGKYLDLNENGEADESHSGLPIIGHIQCNALFLGNPNNTE